MRFLDELPSPIVLRPGVDDLSRFEQPQRGPAGRAAAVVQPRTVDEVREVVRAAVRHGVRLLPQGANTGLVGASVPPDDDEVVVVNLDRLDSQRVDPADGVAVAGAGVRLSLLNDVAGAHRLHLPIDVSSDPAIGGMVSTNTGGSRVLRYGPMAHHVLGLRAVLADAEASVIGSVVPLRKDSRGVDATRVLLGAGGSLGIVVEVAVALTSLPARRETWWLALADADAMLDVYGRLDTARPGLLSAFEFISTNVWRRTLAAPGAPVDPFEGADHSGALLVEWSGPDVALDDLEDDLAALAADGLVLDARRVPVAVAWDFRHRVSTAQRAYGTVLGFDIAAPRGEFVALRQRLIAEVARLGIPEPVCDFGHVGDGGVHFNMATPDADRVPGLRGQLGELIAGVVGGAGYSFSAEHGLGPHNADWWHRFTPPAEQAIIAALKRVTDPVGILGHPGHPYNGIRSATDVGSLRV